MPGGLNIPYSVIEQWPPANYVDPPENGNWAVIFCSILSAIALVVVLTRMCARHFILRSFGLDDWIMLVAIIPAMGYTIFTCIAFKVLHQDRHLWDIPFENYVPIRKIGFISDILYIYASGLIKISILLFYRRLNAAVVTRLYQYIIWSGISIMVLLIAASTLVLPLICRPTRAYWNQFNPTWTESNNFTCIKEGPGVLVVTVIGMLTDFMSIILPLKIFWGLRVPFLQKLASLSIFGVGFFVSAIGCVRIYYVVQVYFYRTFDSSWSGTPLCVWTIVEVMVGAICASLPALKIFVRSKLGGDSSQNTGQSNLISNVRIATFTTGHGNRPMRSTQQTSDDDRCSKDYPLRSFMSCSSDVDITTKSGVIRTTKLDEEKDLGASDISTSSRQHTY